jgi:predicted ATPase
MASEELSDALTMLRTFRAENVRSFRDQLELSLEATVMAEEGVPRLLPWREEGKHSVRVLPAAGVFGANASGKTNLLRAMDDMRRLVLSSFRSGDRSSPIARRPFRLDPESETAPSKFEIDLILNGIRHEYGFVVDDVRVIREWAKRYPHGKAAFLFDRDETGVSNLGEKNRAKSRAVVEILRSNSLFLSAAGAAEHPDLLPLFEWFESNLRLCEASSRERRWAYTTHMLTHEDRRAQILAMLHAADLGITDARTRQPDPEFLERVRKVLHALEVDDDEETTSAVEGFLGIALSHRGSLGDVEFDSSEESLGTLVWLGLLGPVVQALASGSVLLADELESSLHPTLVAQLVRTFQDRRTNPNGAQLIFNSHEAGLLGNSVDDRVLGRDQVWFTEKLNDGRTRLYPLTDLNPRKAEAVGRRYMTGRYGATPIISSAEFDVLSAGIAADRN